MTTPIPFETDFHGRLDDIERRAKAVGSNITRLCKKTGIARATYERWTARAPQTITKVDELAAEVRRLEGMTAEERAEELTAKARRRGRPAAGPSVARKAPTRSKPATKKRARA